MLNDPYSDDYRYYRKYVDKGYKLITGPSSPDSFLGLGVFCTNYFDVLRLTIEQATIFYSTNYTFETIPVYY